MPGGIGILFYGFMVSAECWRRRRSFGATLTNISANRLRCDSDTFPAKSMDEKYCAGHPLVSNSLEVDLIDILEDVLSNSGASQVAALSTRSVISGICPISRSRIVV